MARQRDSLGPDAPSAVSVDADGEDAAIDDVLTLFLAELDALEHFDEHLVASGADADATVSLDEDGGSPTVIDMNNIGCRTVATPAGGDGAAAAAALVATKPLSRKRKRNRAGTANTFWKRQKEELASLRGGVEELQTQLELLQHQREHRLAERSAAQNGGVGGGAAGCEQHLNPEEREAKKQELNELKKRVAREMKARQQAKLENAKLRKLAKEALQMKQSMEDAFAKHPSPSVSTTSALCGMTDLVDVCPAIRVSDTIDTQTYHELERCLDARYADMELMKEGFGRCPERKSPSNLRVINLIVQNENDTSVLLDNSRVIPFPVQLINDVVWQSKRLETLQTKDTAIKVVKRFESTVFMTKQYTIRDSDNKEVVITLQTVFKRYFDGQRLFMAWESIGEWPGDSADGSASFAIREHGWGSAQPFPDPANRSSASTLRASIIVAPDVLPGDASEEALQTAQAKLSDTVIPTHQLAFATRMQQLENLLIDHSIHPR